MTEDEMRLRLECLHLAVWWAQVPTVSAGHGTQPPTAAQVVEAAEGFYRFMTASAEGSQ